MNCRSYHLYYARHLSGDNYTALWYNHLTFERDVVCMQRIYTRKRGNPWS